MPKSEIVEPNWYYEVPPPEMEGATILLCTDSKGAVVCALSYIGCTVFHVSPKATRRYDLDSQIRVGPYIKAIAKKFTESGNIVRSYSFLNSAKLRLGKWLDGVAIGTLPMPSSTSFPPVWSNTQWRTTTVLNPGEDMAKQMPADDADSLLNMLGAKAGPTAIYSPGPASDVPTPAPRVDEGDPTSTKMPPHRKSVIKGLREPRAYIASLMKG